MWVHRRKESVEALNDRLGDVQERLARVEQAYAVAQEKA